MPIGFEEWLEKSRNGEGLADQQRSYLVENVEKMRKLVDTMSKSEDEKKRAAAERLNDFMLAVETYSQDPEDLDDTPDAFMFGNTVSGTANFVKFLHEDINMELIADEAIKQDPPTFGKNGYDIIFMLKMLDEKLELNVNVEELDKRSEPEYAAQALKDAEARERAAAKAKAQQEAVNADPNIGVAAANVLGAVGREDAHDPAKAVAYGMDVLKKELEEEEARIREEFAKDKDRQEFELAAARYRSYDQQTKLIKSELKLTDASTKNREKYLVARDKRDNEVYALWNTNYFFNERKRLYESGLNGVLKDKGVDLNDPKAVEEAHVTVEEVMKKARELNPGKPADIFGRNDYLAEMENRLEKESPMAQLIGEMQDKIEEYKDALGGAPHGKSKIKVSDRIKVQKTPKGIMVKEHAERLYDGFARELQKQNDNGNYMGMNRVNIRPDSKYEIASRFLILLKKMATYQKYLSRDMEQDGIEQSNDMKEENPDLLAWSKKSERRSRINHSYNRASKTAEYLTRMIIHNSDNGARYEKQVMDGLLTQLERQYKLAKKIDTPEHWTEFFKAIDGACFDRLASDFQDFDQKYPEAMELMEDTKDISAAGNDLPDPGHGGLYIRKANSLVIATGNETLESAAMKIIGALTAENTELLGKGEATRGFSWKEVEKEVAHQLAGNKWADEDLSNVTEQQLLTDPTYKAKMDKLAETMESYAVIWSQKDVDKYIKEQNENIPAPTAEERAALAEKAKGFVEKAQNNGWKISKDALVAIYIMNESIDPETNNYYRQKFRECFNEIAEGRSHKLGGKKLAHFDVYSNMLSEEQLRFASELMKKIDTPTARMALKDTEAAAKSIKTQALKEKNQYNVEKLYNTVELPKTKVQNIDGNDFNERKRANKSFFDSLKKADGITTRRYKKSNSDEYTELSDAFSDLKKVSDPSKPDFDPEKKKAALETAYDKARAYLAAKLDYEHCKKKAEWRPTSPAGTARFNGALELIRSVRNEMVRLKMPKAKEDRIFYKQCRVRRAYDPKNSMTFKRRQEITFDACKAILKEILKTNKLDQSALDKMSPDPKDFEKVEELANIVVVKKGEKLCEEYNKKKAEIAHEKERMERNARVNNGKKTKKKSSSSDSKTSVNNHNGKPKPVKGGMKKS